MLFIPVTGDQSCPLECAAGTWLVLKCLATDILSEAIRLIQCTTISLVHLLLHSLVFLINEKTLVLRQIGLSKHY